MARWPRWVRKIAKASGLAPSATSAGKAAIDGRAGARTNGILGYAFDRATPDKALDVEIWVGNRLVTIRRCDQRRPSFAPPGAPDCGFHVAIDEIDADWFGQPVSIRAAGRDIARDPYFLRSLVTLDRTVAAGRRITAVVKAPPAFHRFIRPQAIVDGAPRPATVQSSVSGALLVQIRPDQASAIPALLALRWPGDGADLAGSPSPIISGAANLAANGRFQTWEDGRPAAWRTALRNNAFQTIPGRQGDTNAARLIFPPNPPLQTLFAQPFTLDAASGETVEARVLARAGTPVRLVLSVTVDGAVEEHSVEIGKDWTEARAAFAIPLDAQSRSGEIAIDLRGGSPGTIDIAGLGIGNPGFHFESGLAGEAALDENATIVNGGFANWPNGLTIPFSTRRVETARGWFVAGRAPTPAITARLVEFADPEAEIGAKQSRYGLALAGELEGSRLRLEGAFNAQAIEDAEIGAVSLILGSTRHVLGGAISRIDVIRRVRVEGGSDWTDSPVTRVADAVVVPDRPQRIDFALTPQQQQQIRSEAALIVGDPLRSLHLVMELRPQPLDLLVADVRLSASASASHAATVEQDRWEGVGIFVADGSAITGWAVDRSDLSKPAEVEITCDGVVIGSALADRPHPVLQGAAYRGGRCGFSIPLGPELRDGARHELSLTVKGDSRPLAGMPYAFRLAADRYLSHLDPIDGGVLSGWITDLAATDMPVRLGLQVDGARIAAAPADQRRSDSGHASGFVFKLPQDARAVVLIVEADGWVVARFVGSNEVRDGGERIDPAAIDLAAEARRHVDADWYRTAYPDTADADPVEHWLTEGAAAGRSPNPWFDEDGYRAANPDVAEAVAGGQLHSAFAHWLSHGAGAIPEAQDQDAPVDAVKADTAVVDLVQADGDEDADPVPRDVRALRAVHGRTSVFHRFTTQAITDIGIRNAATGGRLSAGMLKSDASLAMHAFGSGRTDEPLISVIMPTFNRAMVIADAVRSVLDQSWQNWELLICDDGSIDKTPIVIKGIPDPRIRYLPLQKSNGAAARNRGLEFARGDFLAFLDSDNLWHPLFLEAALRTLQTSGAPLLYSGYLDVEMQGSLYRRGEARFQPFDYGELLTRNFVDLNTLMLRREVYDRLGGFDEVLPRVQDWDLILKYAQAYHPVAMEAYPVFYRRNVAWGQVTEMFGHLNFNEIVRNKAQERLESGLDVLIPAPRRRALTIVGGPSWIEAHDALATAAGLRDSADIRLILADSADARALAGATGVNPVWLPDTAGIGPLLWGEAVVKVGDDTPDPTLPAGLPVVPLLRAFDEVIAHGPRPLPIGGLTLFAPVVADGTARGWSLVVIVRNTAGWRPILRAHATADRPVLMVTVDAAGAISAVRFDGKETPAAIDERTLADALADATSLIVDDGAVSPERALVYAGYAMAASATVVLPEASTPPAWAEARLVQKVAVGEPARTLDIAIRAHADQAGGTRMRRRAKSRFNQLQRMPTVSTRLRFALDEIIDHKD